MFKEILIANRGVIPPQDYGFLREAGVPGSTGRGATSSNARRTCCGCSGTICRRWKVS